MENKKLMLLINPSSGKGISKLKIGDIVSRFCQGDFIVDVFMTKHENAEELAHRYAAAHDVIICVGGDGTLSGVVTGLLGITNPPPIGYIPTGTANDIATTLGLSREIETAVEIILDGHLTPLDIGCFGDKFFTYIAAFGAFTGVAYSTPQSAKRAMGHFAYILGGLADMATIHPFHTVVTYDDGVVEDEFIFGGVTNSTSIAGLVRLDPRDVNLGDGKFEVILVKTPMNLSELRDIVLGISTHEYESDTVRLLHTTRVNFAFDEPVPWTRDGENGGAHSEIEITNRARAVYVYTPR